MSKGKKLDWKSERVSPAGQLKLPVTSRPHVHTGVSAGVPTVSDCLQTAPKSHGDCTRDTHTFHEDTMHRNVDVLCCKMSEVHPALSVSAVHSDCLGRQQETIQVRGRSFFTFDIQDEKNV